MQSIIHKMSCNTSDNINNSPALIEKISYELFGKMKYLTPEENAKKMDMYRQMSITVSDISFFD